MQIIKAFFLNVKRQNKTLLIYLSVFIALMVFFAKNGEEQQKAVFKSSSLDMIVQDKDQTTLSRSLFQYLSQKHNIKEDQYTEEQISDELYYENVDYVLTIPKGFEENMASGKTTGILENRKRPGSTSGYFLDAQIHQYLSMLNAYLTAGYAPEEAASLTGKAAAREAGISLLSRQNQAAEDDSYYAFCYMPYILICILTVGLGMILISFRKENVDARLRCSSQSAIQRNLQLALGSIIFSLICWCCLLVAAAAVIHIDFFSWQGFFYILNSFVFLLVAMSITVLISFLVHSDAVLNMVANVVGLGLSFLGGVYVPLEIMSPSVVFFSRLLPSYWYIKALEHIGRYGGKASQLQTILSCLGIEFLFAAAIFCASLVVSRQTKHS